MSAAPGRSRIYVAPPGAWRNRLPRPAAPRDFRHGGLVLGAGVVVTIVATAFVSGGASQLEPTTWTEVALMLLGAALCAAALLVPRSPRTPTRLRGIWTVTAFAALAIYTALSITWSLMPSDSWLEANRTLAYLATFAGAFVLGRLAPGRWSTLLTAVALATVILAGWSVLTKVFPSWLAPNEDFARLRPPSDYWNSVGLTAALGIPPLLWLATRRSGHAAINALAWPGLGVVIVSLLLAYSRGALVAVGIGLVLWFAFVPLRLRGVVTLGGVVFAVVPLVAWTFAQDGLSKDGVAMALRTDAGQGFGALLILMLVALTVAGLAVGFMGDVHTPREATRARAGRTLFGALLAVPLVAILLLANSPGGIDGQISKAWKQMTDPAVTTPTNSPQRLTQTSSSRAQYWKEAWKVHAQAPWLGTGAGAYGTLRTRYRTDWRTVRHAHGYVVQTLADLGWVGLFLSLVAAATWLTAAVRVVGLRRRDLRLPWDAERVGMAALACVPIVFGVHSGIDWTWFFPTNVVPALICAGWVASRATLRERLAPPAAAANGQHPAALVTNGHAPLPSPHSAPAPPSAAARPRAAAPGEEPPPLTLAELARPAGALALIAVALAAAWSALQPVRSAHAQTAAYERIDRGELNAAASIAQIAHERNPLSVDPLFDLASINQARGRRQDALRALEAAVNREPANPETWRRLGQFRVDVQHDLKSALEAYRAAYFLDPSSPRAISDVITTSRQLGVG